MAIIVDQLLFGLVHDFLKVYLPKQKCASPHTIKAYRTTLELLLDFVQREKGVALAGITFEMLDSAMVNAFLGNLAEERQCSATTQNHRLACIRAFFKYAAMMEPAAVIHQREIQKVMPKQVATQPPHFMSEAAVKALLEQPDASTKLGVRDQFFMILLYDTAARIQEALGLRVKDFRLGKTPTVTLAGKGSKIRTVPISQKTVEHFRNYTRIFHSGLGCKPDDPLFYTVQYGEKHPMSDDNVRKFMKAYGEKAHAACPEVPEHIHPHLWRHSRAMHLYQHGMDLTLVSQWLGHVNLETTLIYAHADTEHKRRAIEKAMCARDADADKTAFSRYRLTDDEMIKQLYGLR